MEKLTKEQVYIKINTSNVAEVAKLLDSAGEELFNRKPCLNGETEDFSFIVYSSIGSWTRACGYDDKTEVTLEQLAEILGVHQFKIGDRVKIKESSEYYSYDEPCNPRDITGTIYDIENDTDNWIRVRWDANNKNSYKLADLELVTEDNPEQFVSVTRENLGKIHSAVCVNWQAKIEELLETADRFAVNVDVPLILLKKAYSEANPTQTELLKEIAPLPKEKVTVNVSRFINIYKDIQIVETHLSKEDALKASVKDANYLTTIELTGEYETEV